MMLLLRLLQEKPIIVDVGKPPDPTPDISLNFVVGMFEWLASFCWPPL